MHDTAFQIGALAMNIYADLRTAAILEIGSQDVNGSLREHALPSTNYVGVDLEEGSGVDVVAEVGKALPLSDETFDLVLASSVFEHDPCFWNTFLEMCRVTKEGGYIYVNAPSNGVVHRYPMDNWRFYPDSGRALVQWATAQGYAVTLVESFIADRDQHMWNDFVAVFRKGRITKKLPTTFLHEQVPSSNVLTWKSKEIVRPAEEPQDMILLRGARDRAEALEGMLFEASSERDALRQEQAQLNSRISQAEEQNQRQVAERSALELRLADADEIRGRLTLRESELKQRQEEIEQTRSELARAQTQREEVLARLAVSEARLEAEQLLRQQFESMSTSWREACEAERVRGAELSAGLEGRLEEALTAKDKLETLLEERSAEIVVLSHELERQTAAAVAASKLLGDKEEEFKILSETAEATARSNEGKLAQRYQETATLTNLLKKEKLQSERVWEEFHWLVVLSDRLGNQPRWWGLLPKSWRRARQLKRLRRVGLFDSDAYLQRYPDVAFARLDPLDHYLRHGIGEGRSRN